MIEKPYYIYRHIRSDKNQVFYIGKGKNRRDSYSYERAFTQARRNKIWNAIVNKCGGEYSVEIVMEFDNPHICVEKEIELIELYGRKDIGFGTLANLTNGGDGSWGLIVHKSTRLKRSIHASKPRTQAWIKSIRKARKNGGNGGVVKHGDKLSMIWRRNLSKSKTGSKNPYFGKPTVISKKVINTKSGVKYRSISEAARMEGINWKTLYQYLDGTRKNKTTLRRLE